MKSRKLKKSEVLREGRIKGLNAAMRLIKENIDEYEDDNKPCIFIESHRTGYSPRQVWKRTMTLGELIQKLQELAYDYSEDTPVICSNDNGYTYGAISPNDIGEVHERE